MKFLAFAILLTLVISCQKDDTVSVSGVEVDQAELNLKVDQTQTLNFTILPDNASDKKFNWISRDTAVATITSEGLITAKSWGSTYIVGLANSGNFKDSCLVNVINKKDTLAMGAVSGISYPNDVYYSFTDGIVKVVSRANWTIGFKTNARSSSILINSTLGVNLWEVPTEDTAVWGENNWNVALDTAGLKNSWTSLVDSDTTWSLSAFERNQKGHPDYGWGVYNSITHDVNGNSLFVIQLPDQSYKKIWIKKRAATNNTYTFKYANLDGSSSYDASIACNDYLTKNFVYYDLTANTLVDREPASSSWDILLTRYLEMIYNGTTYVPYPVVGVLQNEGETVAQVTGDTSSDSYSGADFLTAKNTIGSDWKTFSNQTYTYTITPEVRYFIKTNDDKIFKLVFLGFEGSSTGKVIFEKTKLQ